MSPTVYALALAPPPADASDDGALDAEGVAQAPAVEVARTQALAGAERGGAARGLTHGVHGGDDAGARRGLVGGGEAAPGDEQVVHAHGHQAAVGDLVVAGGLQADELTARARGVVDVDG